MKTRLFARRRIAWILPSLALVAFFLNRSFQGAGSGDVHGAGVKGHILRRVLSSEDNFTDVPGTTPSPRCIPSSINDFPSDFLTQEQRRQGGVILHFIIVFYLCGILAYICDDYFVPSLELIADFLKVPSDVAGATFMAVGTSAPELFSSVIGSFITEGDIGVGTIVGSAVFNVLGVTGVVGLAVWKNDVHVDWFPVTRDCTMYAVTVIALIGVISNNVVQWYEALVLILLFVIYIVILMFNARIQYASILQVREEWALLVAAYRAYQAREERSSDGAVPCLWEDCNGGQQYHVHSVRSKVDLVKQKWFGSTGSVQKENEPTEETPLLGSAQHRQSVHRADARSYDTVAGLVYVSPKDSLPVSDAVTPTDDSEEDSLWSYPSGSLLKRASWVLFWPARLLLRFTIPDCRSEEKERWSGVTFVMSVAWIGGVSYLAVWMVTIIGYTLGIPDSVSGITILAAGTSVPELISSVIVARTGLGNMAICNLLGSNIFDILFCLGVPWLIKTLVSPTKSLAINSSALTYTTVALLSTVLLMFVTFLVARWKLNYKVGFTCIVMYVMFIIIACMYELNVFGEFSLPPCA
ncbi:sodium/potassium/calcium exchanger 3-like isoform X1 [Ornithodoros turicata]|uniref:sodium/potassium/calcium exchanger 3-like isoform X1 n=1 Tax=Ornithodoros turicata TaxID=34597 RepID=UPI003139834E